MSMIFEDKIFPIFPAARPKSFSVFNLALAAALIGSTKNLFRASKFTWGTISRGPAKLKRSLNHKKGRSYFNLMLAAVRSLNDLETGEAD